jgi:hypothetical protein
MSDAALFNMKRAPYKWVIINRCIFNLTDGMYYTIEGVNHEIKNSIVDFSRIEWWIQYQR